MATAKDEILNTFPPISAILLIEKMIRQLFVLYVSIIRH